MKLTSSISINGVPGSGKTYAVAKLVTDLGAKAYVLDFERKFAKTVSQQFPDFLEQFEIEQALVRNEKSNTKMVKNEKGKFARTSMNISFKFEPDYVRSFDRLKDEIMPAVLERNDFDILIYDGATPLLRNPMGLNYWLHLHPDRESPSGLEWGTMNSWELAFIEAGKGWAEENDKLFIVTGQMEDVYKEGSKPGESVKVGQVPAIKEKSQHSIDVVLELRKKVYKDHTEYHCCCLDSIKGQFIEYATLEKHVVDILLEKGLLSY